MVQVRAKQSVIMHAHAATVLYLKHQVVVFLPIFVIQEYG